MAFRREKLTWLSLLRRGYHFDKTSSALCCIPSTVTILHRRLQLHILESSDIYLQRCSLRLGSGITCKQLGLIALPHEKKVRTVSS